MPLYLLLLLFFILPLTLWNREAVECPLNPWWWVAFGNAFQ